MEALGDVIKFSCTGRWNMKSSCCWDGKLIIWLKKSENTKLKIRWGNEITPEIEIEIDLVTMFSFLFSIISWAPGDAKRVYWKFLCSVWAQQFCLQYSSSLSIDWGW